MKSFRGGKKIHVREVVSKSPEETQRIGSELSKSFPIPGIVLLHGALGTGKTTLTRGMAEGLGLGDPGLVNSPSFTLVNIYQGVCPIYHVDLYRLRNERDLYLTGLGDFMGTEGVTIIEWAERLGYTPSLAIVIEIEDAGDDLRKLRILMPSGNRKEKLKSETNRSRKGLRFP